MKTLYLDCGMGAAGDMLSAALLELLPDPDAFVAELDALGIPGVTYVRERAEKCGIVGTHLSVLVYSAEEGDHPHEHDHDHEHDHRHDDHGHDHDHEREHDHDHDQDQDQDQDQDRDHDSEDHGHRHAYGHEHEHEHEHGHEHHHNHSGLRDIERIVSGLALSDKVRGEVLSVYRLIAEAEGHVHGTTMDQIHFHEVGTMDAVADVTACCLLMDRIAPDEVIASPVRVGSGSVRCAHGILPVPAPATAWLLRGIPIYGGEIQGELCTPTGAALLRHLVDRSGPMPPMTPTAFGYGMGKKDFDQANCVRAVLGETGGSGADTVAVLECGVDDMTAEEISFAMGRLFEGGAKEVFTTAVGMKKSRPGTLLTVLCAEEDRRRMAELLFRHTATIGIRERSERRYVLDRTEDTRQTPWGTVRRKRSSGFGVVRTKWEHEDLARIARERGESVTEVRARLDALEDAGT